MQVLKCQKLVDFPDSDNGWKVCALLQLPGGKERCTGAKTDRINPKFAESLSLFIHEAGRERAVTLPATDLNGFSLLHVSSSSYWYSNTDTFMNVVSS